MSDDKTSRSETSPAPRKKDVLVEWRDRNIAELDRNLATWKAIRDDPEASDKDRIEAAKAIARQMGALSPDPKKTEREEKRDEQMSIKPLKEGHAKELEEILRGL